MNDSNTIPSHKIADSNKVDERSTVTEKVVTTADGHADKGKSQRLDNAKESFEDRLKKKMNESAIPTTYTYKATRKKRATVSNAEGIAQEGATVVSSGHDINRRESAGISSSNATDVTSNADGKGNNAEKHNWKRVI